ncbi:MAG: hypothetical protein AAFP76_04575 [Bacteroidota bacterium]
MRQLIQPFYVDLPLLERACTPSKASRERVTLEGKYIKIEYQLLIHTLKQFGYGTEDQLNNMDRYLDLSIRNQQVAC